MSFGEWLGNELDRRGLSMSAFAEQLDVSQPAVSNWIKGKRRPDVESAAKIAGSLHLPLKEVIARVSGNEFVPEQEGTLQHALNDLLFERDELETRIDDSEQRLLELNARIEEVTEQLEWAMAQRTSGIHFGPSGSAVRGFLDQWEPLTLSRMPEELRVAYVAGYEAGHKDGRKEGFRAALSRGKRANRSDSLDRSKRSE